MESLNKLFEDELKDVFDAEKQLVKALPKMAESAENDELRKAFENHLQQTKQHVSRLEQVFQELGKPAQGKKCAGMEGLIEEGSEKIEEEAGDAALIAAAQKVEHYEISAYGTLSTWAKTLGHDKAATLLEQTLDEESKADELLGEIASTVNEEAADAEGEEEEGEEVDKKRGQKAA